MEKLRKEKLAGTELQKRRHPDWDDSYLLYRNKVKTNRLTQRQAVNIPLMKETVKTLLSKIDDMPDVAWKELGGDDQKELIYQEVWNNNIKPKNANLELLDILDKKNVLLYGISAMKLNIASYGVDLSVPDVYDLVFDPMMNPWDLESARFIVHQNIFRSIREILADSRYSQKGKDDLKIWAETPPAIMQSQEAKKEWEKKMERARVMGVGHKDFALYAGGDTIVNLTEHYTSVWNDKTNKFEKRVVVYANDSIELFNESMMDCLGVDFWPFVVWSEDPETNDIYPDAIADLVRTPNKIINIWFSQLIENRTLKNFQMHWVAASESYTPQTYTPGPGMQLPAPPLQAGQSIRDVVMPVEISGLDDTLQAINAIVNIVERGTGATAIEKGQPEGGQQTLGEVQILVGKANERTVGMAKFYKVARYQLAWKWDKIMQANAPKMLKLFKVSRKGKAFPKNVYQSDWRSEEGYEPMVTSSSEQEQSDIKTMQKWLFVTSKHPNNVALQKLAMKRELKLLDVTPEELREVEEAEKQLLIQQPTAQDAQTQQLTDSLQQQVGGLVQ